MLTTEQMRQEHANLDLYSNADLVNAFIKDQLNAVNAVQDARSSLCEVIDAAVPRIAAGGRLIYVGAGTSGRLGLLDSVELYPTFSWDRSRSIALMAGGDTALYEAVEGAEDDVAAGSSDLSLHLPTANDVVFLIAASGRTPYVIGACQRARESGSLTVAIVNNGEAPISVIAEHAIVLSTGPEVISGSTRLKAGTAQKIALNTLSSAIMVRLHKVYGNLMVDLKATNEKLIQRAINLTAFSAGVEIEEARTMLERCQFQIKVAIVALKCEVEPIVAQALLNEAQGSIRAAIEKQNN
ncbi:N-acetylmuramic acid 6-phosphate etherase [Undibacterium sp. Ji67W]|uniref:N-acetylmuramic acid 6-phosphate etherase n=1 Tax=Undibacterium sp. Ji67W TaxID=3413042 RepID=UPI003BF1ADFB